jgi:hypothetical protein
MTGGSSEAAFNARSTLPLFSLADFYNIKPETINMSKN